MFEIMFGDKLCGMCNWRKFLKMFKKERGMQNV
jgi:hypothetical protein